MADRTRRAEKRAATYAVAPPDDDPLAVLGRRVELFDDCWVVDGKLDCYPEVYAHGGSERANRYIWRQTHDVVRIRDGVHIHHTCEVKGCINPNHLVALTASDHRRVHSGSVAVQDAALSAADVECAYWPTTLTE